MPLFTVHRQRMVHYLLVTTLLLLQVNLNLHQPLAHSTQEPSPHAHAHSSDVHTLDSVPELNDLHEHLADHNSVDHSHQTLCLTQSFVLHPTRSSSVSYDYKRSHRAPIGSNWLRPPRPVSAT